MYSSCLVKTTAMITQKASSFSPSCILFLLTLVIAESFISIYHNSWTKLLFLNSRWLMLEKQNILAVFLQAQFSIITVKKIWTWTNSIFIKKICYKCFDSNQIKYIFHLFKNAFKNYLNALVILKLNEYCKVRLTKCNCSL